MSALADAPAVPVSAARGSWADLLAGTGTLAFLILRRDRVRLAIWMALVVLAPAGFAASAAQLYASPAALQAYAAESMRTPSAVAMLGLVFSPSLGGVVAWRTGLQSAILIGPISLLFVIRHTRVAEAAGHRELLGSTAVGRLAPLAAALAVVLGANLAIAALIAAALIALGLPAAGAIALGLSAASAGWMLAGMAAVAAQVAESPGVARGLGLGVFALAYLARIAGDARDGGGSLAWLSWASPLGWVRLTRAFASEQWRVFALPLALTAACVAAAAALCSRRDVGAGLLPRRPGPAGAAPGLRGPLALAWRQQRGGLLALLVAALVFGGLLGSIGHGMSAFVDAPQLQDWAARAGARDAGDAFLFMLVYVLGQAVAAYAVAAALRPGAEETAGRAELLLAVPDGRARWAASYLAIAVLGPAAVLAALGIGLSVAYGLAAGDVVVEAPRLFARALSPLPAIWVMAGLAAAAYGAAPRHAGPIAWGALALFLALELAWEVRQIGQAVFDLSPFAHVHWAAPVTAGSLAGLTAVAAVLASAGLLALRRRDIGV